MSDRVFIGIDPGQKGGMVILRPHRKVNAFYSMGFGNVSEAAIVNAIREVATRSHCEIMAILEKVGGYVKGVPNPGNAMFNFGASVGLIRGALLSSEIPFEEVVPAKWQKGMGIPKKPGEDQRDYKRRVRSKAEKLFPGAFITLQTSDAAMIAEYCRRREMGSL